MSLISVGMFCCFEASQEYPKRVPVGTIESVQIHNEPNQVCIGTQCSCKMVPHFVIHECLIRKQNKGRWGRGSSYRNSGRKPKYKNRRGIGADRRVIAENFDGIGEYIMKMPPPNFGIKKDGEMRAKYKRPFIKLTD